MSRTSASGARLDRLRSSRTNRRPGASAAAAAAITNRTRAAACGRRSRSRRPRWSRLRDRFTASGNTYRLAFVKRALIFLMNIAKDSITRPMKIEVMARSQTSALGSMIPSLIHHRSSLPLAPVDLSRALTQRRRSWVLHIPVLSRLSARLMETLPAMRRPSPRRRTSPQLRDAPGSSPS
jgi:hypothetical protein